MPFGREGRQDGSEQPPKTRAVLTIETVCGADRCGGDCSV